MKCMIPHSSDPSGAAQLRKYVVLFGCIAFLCFLAGCGSNASVTTSSLPSPAVTIAANPTSLVVGASSTLTVAATNATQVSVTGTDGSSFSLASGGGTHVVTPTATATYTATATGTAGKASATAAATITVSAPVAAPTITIAANPTSISAGSSSVLTIVAANATQVVVTGTDGSSYTIAPTGGQQSVSPSATTTYTATATGLGGKATATVQINVVAVPIVTIVASPTSIASGSSSTLTVTATNATQVTVTGPSGTFTLQPAGGTMQVSPTSTSTYTATATGAGGTRTASATVTVTAAPAATVSIVASPTSITTGNASTLTVVATNATQVILSGGGTSYTLSATGGTESVSPTATTVYTATASGTGASATAAATVTVTPPGSLMSIDHVIFMLQENHTFDNYFGMLNPYRVKNGWNVGADGNNYSVDGIDDKLTTISNESDEGTSYPLFKFTSTCIDDETSSWLESYGDVSRYDFSTTRSINMDGFVHTAENYAKNCNAANGVGCAGTFTDLTGQHAMGYYDQGFLNYYYYMASQFAVSDRWFSPLSSKSIPNRIATFTGGTTQGLVFDPGGDDHLPQLNISNIFQELDQNNVSWKIYYTVTQGACLSEDDCAGGASSEYPATNFGYLAYSYQYLYENPIPAGATSAPACVAPTVASSAVGDTTNSFCIDTNHIAPLSTYYSDLQNGTLPSFAFIEAGYGNNDEHPGSGQSILNGQVEVSTIVNKLMASSAWKDSVFFLAYDEGGGPYDHVPPVPGSSNKNTDAMVGSEPVSSIPDISAIAVNPDTYPPCLSTGATLSTTGVPTTHCDLQYNDPGAQPTDAAAVHGFAAQLGFRVPNMVISPFTRAHYVSHIPMDHTAILKFVENRFIGPTAHLTNRDAAQPNLLDFFDFNNVPWSTPPTPPAAMTDPPSGPSSCTPASFAP
ncbi:MAG: hypothetical protein HIU91_06300 [Acidobacteria bacterium]|nr:hypothetical protein [Acidobacteriota bacterium]